MTWVQFPARISAVYCKRLPINDLFFRFLLEHQPICYKFSNRVSNQEICSSMLYQNIVLENNFVAFFPIFSFFNADLAKDYNYRVVNCRSKNYVIFISQINLSPFWIISEKVWCYVIQVFLFRFLLSGIFAILYQYSP